MHQYHKGALLSVKRAVQSESAPKVPGPLPRSGWAKSESRATKKRTARAKEKNFAPARGLGKEMFTARKQAR